MSERKMAAAAALLVMVGASMASTAAEARGAASNIMNSPGYQRRLQESRGFVTTYSNGYPERGPLYRYRHPSPAKKIRR